MSIGDRIINMIIEAGLLKAECPDSPESSCLITWSANAPEQLRALVEEYVENPLFIRRSVCMTHRFDTVNRVCLQCGMTELGFNLRNGRSREQ